MARGLLRSWLLPVVGVSILAVGTACGPQVVKEQTNMEETTTYKTVDDGTLNVIVNNQPLAEEEFTIEKGSDGHWLSSAMVKPLQPNQNTRDVRVEFGANLEPISYSEDAQGATPMKVFIGFTPESASIIVKQGDQPEKKQDLPGKVDAFMGDNLFHQASLLVRAYLNKNTTEPAEFGMLGGAKLQVSELEPAELARAAGPVALRHFLLNINNQQKLHVWVQKEDLRLIKVELPRLASATKKDIPEAETLTAVPPKPVEPVAPATPATPAAPATPAPPAKPAPKK